MLPEQFPRLLIESEQARDRLHPARGGQGLRMSVSTPNTIPSPIATPRFALLSGVLGSVVVRYSHSRLPVLTSSAKMSCSPVVMYITPSFTTGVPCWRIGRSEARIQARHPRSFERLHDRGVDFRERREAGGCPSPLRRAASRTGEASDSPAQSGSLCKRSCNQREQEGEFHFIQTLPQGKQYTPGALRRPIRDPSYTIKDFCKRRPVNPRVAFTQITQESTWKLPLQTPTPRNTGPRYHRNLLRPDRRQDAQAGRDQAHFHYFRRPHSRYL